MRRRGRLGVAVAVALLAAVSAGCRDARQLSDVQVDAVRVGSEDVLSESESRFVVRSDDRNAQIRESLVVFFDALEAGEVAAMNEAAGDVEELVADFSADLATQSDADIVATYEPYLPAWGRVVAGLRGMADAVAAGDRAGIEASARAYDRSIGEITALDALQVQRLRPVLGDEQLRRLLTEQGVDPATFGLEPDEPSA